MKGKIIGALKEFWKFIWEGESFASYLAFFLFSIIVLSIAYPLTIKLLSVTVGINNLVSVITSSMVHKGDQTEFYNYWKKRGLNRTEVPFKNGLNPGDLVVVKKDNNITVGEVVVFEKNGNTPIIHRVIEKRKINGRYYYQTKGDANPYSLTFEKNLTEKDIKGTAAYRIPFLGIPKMLLTRFLIKVT